MQHFLSSGTSKPFSAPICSTRSLAEFPQEYRLLPLLVESYFLSHSRSMYMHELCVLMLFTKKYEAVISWLQSLEVVSSTPFHHAKKWFLFYTWYIQYVLCFIIPKIGVLVHSSCVSYILFSAIDLVIMSQFLAKSKEHSAFMAMTLPQQKCLSA